MTQKYAVVDLETTGFEPGFDRIIEVAIIITDGHNILQTYETLINPGRNIPESITALTGITQSDVDRAPKFRHVAQDILEIITGTLMVAHNASFDYRFLNWEFGRLGIPFDKEYLCTMTLSRRIFPGLKSYALDKITAHLGINMMCHHNAMSDALAAADILKRVLDHERGPEQVILRIKGRSPPICEGTYASGKSKGRRCKYKAKVLKSDHWYCLTHAKKAT